jgi:hypothetical protein
MVAEYKKKLEDMDEVTTHLQLQKAELKKNIVENRGDSRELKHDIDVYYDKTMCERAHVYEQMDVKNIAKAAFDGNDLHISRSFTHGVWDDEKLVCKPPTFDNSKCTSFTVECGYPGTFETYTVNGRDHPSDSKTCIFPYCPVYCESYVGDCWDVVLNDSEQFEFRSNLGRNNCVNRDDSTAVECKSLDVAHCPPMTEYYYHSDNMSIRSNLKLASISNNICMYESSLSAGILSFESLEEALDNCRDMPIHKECYVHNIEYDRFAYEKHDLDRTNCDYGTYDSNICQSLSDLQCDLMSTLYTPDVGTYNDNGLYEHYYIETTVPRVLQSNDLGGYECVPSNGNENMFTIDTIDESCYHDRCFSADGSDMRVVTGNVDERMMKCVVEDCFSQSQQKTLQDCLLKEFFYIENDTIIQSNYDIQLVNNVCTYNTPYTGEIYATYSEAAMICSGMSDSFTCFQNTETDVYQEVTVPLQHTNCSYAFPSGCLSEDEVHARACSSSTPIYHFENKEYSDDGTMTFRINAIENIHVLAKTPSGYACEPQSTLPPNHYHSTENMCSNVCYTSAFEDVPITKMGLIEDGICTIGDCYEFPQTTPPVDATSPVGGATPPVDEEGDDDPRTSNENPRTSNENPRTSNDDPRTSNENPRTSNDDPRTSNDDPRTSNDDPRTSNADGSNPSNYTRTWNPETNLYEVKNLITGETHYESSTGEIVDAVPNTSLVRVLNPQTGVVRYLDPKTGAVYNYSASTGAYTNDNRNNLSTHTITSSGRSYYTSVSGGVVEVDEYGRIEYTHPQNGSVLYSDPETGLVTYVNAETGETMYVDPITKRVGFMRSDGYVVFTNSAGNNYYVNIRTGVMTDDITLHDYENVFQRMR